jgi:hypothetical protein
MQAHQPSDFQRADNLAFHPYSARKGTGARPVAASLTGFDLCH